MSTPDQPDDKAPGTGPTQRQQFLAAADEIRDAFEAARGDIGSSARNLVRDAYRVLYVLGTHIPDVPAGSPLRYGGMDDTAIARALRAAEKGMASPAVTLELIAELRRLRAELRAIGGPSGVTDDDIRSMLSEGFHTAFRKAVPDNPYAMVIHELIRKLTEDRDGQGHSSWSAVISFVANPLIRELRRAESGQPENTQSAAEGEVAALHGELAARDAEIARFKVAAQNRNMVLLDQLTGNQPELLGYVAGARPALGYEGRYQGTLALPGRDGVRDWACCHTHSADDAVACARASAAGMGWALRDGDTGKPAPGDPAWNSPEDAVYGEYTPGQQVEFRNRTRGAEWEPGTFVSSEEGTALVTDSKGTRIRTPAERVRPWFTEGQPIEFRVSPRETAAWRPGVWLGWTGDGQVHVQVRNGYPVLTISPDRVRPRIPETGTSNDREQETH